MMNINNKATRRGIVERYLNAETSLEEEKALYEFYSHTKETLSDDEKMVCQLVLSTANLTDDFELSDEKTEAFDRIMNEQDKRSSRRIMWPWLAAACIATILVVLLAPPKDEVGRRNYEGGRELSKEVKSMKEEVLQTSKLQNGAKHLTSSIKHQTSNIKQSSPTMAEDDQSDLVSVENVFGIESRPDPLEEYTALEEKLQKECDEVFSRLKIEN